MKVVFFIGYFPEVIGGAQLQARLLYNELSKYHQIIYISYPHKNYSHSNNIYRLSINSKLHKFTLYFFWMRKIKKIILKEKPDFIYQRVLNSFSFYLSIFSKKYNIPFVLNIADNYSLQFNKISLSTFVRKFFFKQIIKSNPIFICQTIQQESILKSYTSKNIYLIPNIYPQKYTSQIKCKSERSGFVWIGNVREVKNIELYLRVAQEYPDILFKVIGEIPDNIYGKKIYKMIKELKNVVYYGVVIGDNIFQIIDSSLALVNTSYSEGLSNTFIESWQTGTPVISFNSNPNDYFTYNNLGFYCNGSVDELLKSVRIFQNISENDYKLFSISCTEFAKNEFNPNKIINQFLKIFSK